MPWAKHKDEDGKRRPLSANPPGGGFVAITDMPAPNPGYQRPRVKGVCGPTIEADEDHQPGGGSWSGYLGNHYSPGTGEPVTYGHGRWRDN